MHMCEIQLAIIGALKSYKDYDEDCKTYSQGIGNERVTKLATTGRQDGQKVL